ncbi:MAG: MFS transporter [Gammaproteobacteria bacterium]|nr:MFS transporter [Gammaproteobacteria bacterium]
MKKQKLQWLAVLVCTLATLFYLYEFSLQVSLGVMTHELMFDMSLNAASLGMISAAYYYAYTPMQIPGGVLHDKYGPRRVLTAATLICATGALCFALSGNIFQASLGRFLMGIGSAFSFSGALMLIARWFPAKYFAILSGIVQLMSSIGAIAGQVPLAISIHHWGWRHSMFGLAMIGAILAAAIWFVVHDFPADQKNHATLAPQYHDKPKGLKQILRSKETRWIASYSFLIWAPVTTFAGLWGVPFLVIAYHLSTASASIACAFIWLGIGIGSPLSGWLSESLQKRAAVLTGCSLLGLISSILVIYVNLPLPALYGFLFLLGIAGGGQSLAFCVVKDISHPSSIGTSIGINNMATVAGGALLQPVIGWLLLVNWHGAMNGNAPLYGVSEYHLGLLLIPACYFLATLISAFRIAETHCQSRYTVMATSE